MREYRGIKNTHYSTKLVTNTPRTTLPRSIHHVQPKLKFIPPAFNPLVLRIVQWFLPILLRFRIQPGYLETRIETANVEGLVELYRQFQAGKIRF